MLGHSLRREEAEDEKHSQRRAEKGFWWQSPKGVVSFIEQCVRTTSDSSHYGVAGTYKPPLFNLIMAVFIEYVMTESLRRKQHERGRNAVELECRLKAVICELSRRIKPRESSQLLRIAGTVRKWLSGSFRNPSSRSRSTLRESGQLDRQISELNADLAITRPVFNMWLKDPDMLNLLDALDINMANLTDLFDVLDADLSGQLDVHELISGLMRLRGPPEKCDTIETLLGVRHMTSMLEDIRFRLGE